MFAILAFWLMFLVGIPEVRPVVGTVSGIAAQAGIETDDVIVEVDGQETRTWSHAVLELIAHALDRESVQVTVENPGGERSSQTLELGLLGSGFAEDVSISGVLEDVYWSSAAWGDYDNDGDLDLACTSSMRENALFLNDNGVLEITPSWMSDILGWIFPWSVSRKYWKL